MENGNRSRGGNNLSLPRCHDLCDIAMLLLINIYCIFLQSRCQARYWQAELPKTFPLFLQASQFRIATHVQTNQYMIKLRWGWTLMLLERNCDWGRVRSEQIEFHIRFDPMFHINEKLQNLIQGCFPSQRTMTIKWWYLGLFPLG